MKTKQLHKKIAALEKENLTLKAADQSELKMKVIELEQSLEN